MRVPQQSTHNHEPHVTQYEYTDHQLIVADFGPTATTSTDIVDDTVIIVTETNQHEFELPDDMNNVEVTNNNGIVSIKVDS